MRQKGFKEIIILSGILIAAFSLFFVFNIEKREKLFNLVQKRVNKLDIPTSDCARAGEEPVSNFDLRTGKIDKSITVINCCTGLKEINKKQVGEIKRINSGDVICGMSFGVPNSVCSPCGNGKCDTKYEDICNCPDDCK